MKVKKNEDPVDQFNLMEEYEQGLRIDKNSLDEEWLAQPELFYRVSKQHARFLSDKESLKVDIEILEAQLYSSIRQQMEEEVGDSKQRITEAAIKSKVAATPEMQRLVRAHMQASERAASMLALKESYQQRSYALKDLVNLYTSNYFTVESGSKSQGEAHTRIADKNRVATGTLRREAREARKREIGE